MPTIALNNDATATAVDASNRKLMLTKELNMPHLNTLPSEGYYGAAHSRSAANEGAAHSRSATNEGAVDDTANFGEFANKPMGGAEVLQEDEDAVVQNWLTKEWNKPHFNTLPSEENEGTAHSRSATNEGAVDDTANFDEFAKKPMGGRTIEYVTAEVFQEEKDAAVQTMTPEKLKTFLEMPPPSKTKMQTPSMVQMKTHTPSMVQTKMQTQSMVQSKEANKNIPCLENKLLEASDTQIQQIDWLSKELSRPTPINPLLFPENEGAANSNAAADEGVANSRFVKALVHLLTLATLCSMKQVHATREC